jgi:Tfp pilus assembly protein PilF
MDALRERLASLSVYGFTFSESCAELSQDQLALARASGDRAQETVGLNNRGKVQQALGDLAGARASYERALRILENSQVPTDHPNIEVVQGNLESLEEWQMTLDA